jgi:Zn-dependent protease
MFIPFLGAFIKLKEEPKSVRQEAISAIGGPLAGTLVAVICLVFWDITGSPYWVGLAYITAFINLFNLLPLGMLDGGRITKALSPLIWVLGIIIAVLLIWKMQIYILVLVLVFGVIEIVQMFKKRKELAAYLEVEPQFRFRMGASYLLLLVVLAGLMMYSLDISETFIRSLRG